MIPANVTYTGPDLCSLDAHEVVDLLRKKQVSPVELLDACFSRIATVEPSVNAIPTVCEDRARNKIATIARLQATRGDRAGWLGGLPVGIKDLSAVAGVRTTYGTMGLKDFVPEANDPIVDTIEANGGIVVGKTNTPEMGAGGNTFNEVFGRTRNPWNTAKNAGGSSGGAAVSLATGEVWLSQGSDLAGSLRTPAGYCGVVGMRPSPGRAGGGPAAFGFNTEGVQGPMARNVRDCALFLDAMCGFDPLSPISLEAPTRSFFDACNRPKTDARIAWAGDFGGFAPIDSDIRDILVASLKTFEGAGGTVDEAYPEIPELEKTYRTIRAMLWAMGPGKAPQEVQSQFKATLGKNIQQGRDLTIDDVYDAQIDRTTLFNNVQDFLNTYDAIAMPVVGLKTGNVEDEYPAIIDGSPCEDYLDWLKFSFLSTTTSHPSIVVPAGFSNEGTPVGIQLIGPNRGEAKLLQIARAFELAMNFPLKPIDPIVPD